VQLETFFPYRLAVAAEAFSRNLVAVYGRTYGLSREEWRLLFLIEGAGRISSLDLARRSTLGKVQISRATRRLEDKKIITCRVPDEDRRLREYAITETGRALFAEVFAQVDGRAHEILAAMTPEDRAALDRGIEALMRAVRETTPADVLAPEPRSGPAERDPN